MDNIPNLPFSDPSNFKSPPSIFFTLSLKCVAMSSGLVMMAEAECMDVNFISSFWSFPTNKPDKSNQFKGRWYKKHLN